MAFGTIKKRSSTKEENEGVADNVTGEEHNTEEVAPPVAKKKAGRKKKAAKKAPVTPSKKDGKTERVAAARSRAKARRDNPVKNPYRLDVNRTPYKVVQQFGPYNVGEIVGLTPEEAEQNAVNIEEYDV